MHVVYHSILWSYLAPAAQERIRGALAAAGARATPEAPLAWLRLEADPPEPDPFVTLTLWPTGETRRLARADFHGNRVHWSGW